MLGGDIPPPQGRATVLLGIPAVFPQLSETSLEQLATADRSIAAAWEESGNWLRGHRDHTADLLKGEAGMSRSTSRKQR